MNGLDFRPAPIWVMRTWDVRAWLVRVERRICKCCWSWHREVDASDGLCRGQESCCGVIMQWAINARLMDPSAARGEWFSGTHWNEIIVGRWLDAVERLRAAGFVTFIDPPFWHSATWAVASDQMMGA